MNVFNNKSAFSETDQLMVDQVSYLCHEIRNPLNGVFGYCELLASTTLNKEQEDLLSGIKRSSRQVLYVMNNLLSSYGTRFIHQDDSPSVFTIQSVINEVVNSLKPKFIGNSVDFFCSCSADSNLRLVGNQTSLYQICINLLHNALKFTKEGFIELHVSVCNETMESVELIIKITDTGVGIGDNDLNNIFLPYFTAEDSKKLNKKGSGIGLAVVKTLLHCMEGEVQVKSYVDFGTSFILTIPMKKSLDDSGFAKRTFGHNERILFNHRKSKILVVEDSEINRLLFVQILRKQGYAVCSASNFHDALRYMDLYDFDLVVCDYYLPDKSGLELIHECQKKNFKIKFLIISALDFSDFFCQDCRVEVLVKPVLPEVFLKTVREYLNINNGVPKSV